MWFIWALFSAFFAALNSVLAKIGIQGVSSTLATAISTAVGVVMVWTSVFITNAQKGLTDISSKCWVFLILSGIVMGGAWLCYFKALELGDASKVLPIEKSSIIITLFLAFVFLHEEVTIRSLIGCLLVGAGTLVMVL